MRHPALTLIFLIALFCSARAFADGGTILATGAGAALGGFLGSQIGQGSGQLAATGAGVALGGLAGYEIGRGLDAEPITSGSFSAASAPSMFSDAPPTYPPYAPNYVAPPAPPPAPPSVPPPTYVDPHAGTYCRPYSQEIRIDGEIKESYGTACLQPDGTWRIIQ